MILLDFQSFKEREDVLGSMGVSNHPIEVIKRKEKGLINLLINDNNNK